MIFILIILFVSLIPNLNIKQHICYTIDMFPVFHFYDEGPREKDHFYEEADTLICIAVISPEQTRNTGTIVPGFFF